MINKPDFLKECMSDVGQGPIDLFQKAFCFVCANRECSRSSANNMAFDRRMSSWKKDLFDNVPRADESDPRFASIRSKKFVTINNIEPIVVNSNIISNPETFISMSTDGVSPTDIDIPTEQPVIQQPVIQQMTQPPTPSQPVQNSSQANTPFSHGAVLPGFKIEQADVVIEPGGNFTFGDGNE